MPFHRILSDLLDRVDGALGAIFLDWEGETVELVGRGSSHYDLKLAGAYQGIFLDRLRSICGDSGLGEPRSFKLHMGSSTFLNCTLDDGYYLVLAVRTGTLEAMAWEQLRKTRDRLLQEM